MASPIEKPGSVSQTPQVPTTAGAQAAKVAKVGKYTSDTRISSMKDLREKAPDVHKAMLEGIGLSIVRRMRMNQERLKKLWREGRQGR